MTIEESKKRKNSNSLSVCIELKEIVSNKWKKKKKFWKYKCSCQKFVDSLSSFEL